MKSSTFWFLSIFVVSGCRPTAPERPQSPTGGTSNVAPSRPLVSANDSVEKPADEKPVKKNSEAKPKWSTSFHVIEGNKIGASFGDECESFNGDSFDIPEQADDAAQEISEHGSEYGVVTETYLRAKSISPRGARSIATIASLKSLRLHGMNLGAESIREIASSRSLESLDFSTNESDDALSFPPGLRRLTLTGPSIGAKALANLHSLKYLKDVAIYDSELDETVVASLAQLPVLRTLRLGPTSRSRISQLKALTKLRELHIYLPEADDQVWSLECKLDVLIVSGTMTVNDFSAIGAISSLKQLTISDNSTVLGIEGLAALANLERLLLYQIPATDDDLVKLHGLTKLTELLAPAARASGAGLGELGCSNTLERLTLNGAHVTEEGLQSLSQFKKLKTVGLSYMERRRDLQDRLKAMFPTIAFHFH